MVRCRVESDVQYYLSRRVMSVPVSSLLCICRFSSVLGPAAAGAGPRGVYSRLQVPYQVSSVPVPVRQTAVKAGGTAKARKSCAFFSFYFFSTQQG